MRKEIESVLSKGYGNVSKLVMLDPQIPIQSKAIYALFCSYTGKQDKSVYPGRNRILAELGIPTCTYYKYFQILVRLGLIIKDQAHSAENGRFRHNVYTVVNYPEDYVFGCMGKSDAEVKALTQVRNRKNIYAAGYGAVSRMVMEDQSISAKAKAVYSYLCAFAGDSVRVSPTKSAVLYHLRISAGTYNRLCRELETAGYIIRRQTEVNGKFSSVEYMLTGVKNTVAHKLPQVKIQHTVKQHVVKPHTVKQDTNNNSHKTKTDITINRFNQSSVETHEKSSKSNLADRWTESHASEKVFEEMNKAHGLPYEYCFDTDRLETAIRILTKNDALDLTSGSGENCRRYNAFVQALVDLLSANTPAVTIRGANITYAKAYQAFQSVIKFETDELGTHFISAERLFARVNARYIKAREINRVRNPFGFMKSVIWTELMMGDIETDDWIAYDFSSMRTA